MNTGKSFNHACLGLLLAVLSTGCYEGWDVPQVKTGSPAPKRTVPVATRTFAYILFQPITMSAGAVASDTCFPASGLRQYRSNEWSMRVDSIGAALQALADTVTVVPIQISASDCTKLAAVQAAALDTQPWGTANSPADVTGDRAVVHLKAAFWEGDPGLTPPDVVATQEWAAWQTLRDSGKPAFSRLYTVISTNTASGYFSEWLGKAGPNLKGTSIDQVDPSNSGIAARQTRVSSDTDALVTWLQGQTP